MGSPFVFFWILSELPLRWLQVRLHLRTVIHVYGLIFF